MYLNISYAQQNKKYENYLSEQIGNTLRPMGTKINDAKIILEKVNKSGYISKDDMNSLCNCYYTFEFGMQDLCHLYSMIEKNQYMPIQPCYYYQSYNELSILNREKVQSGIVPLYTLTDSDKESFRWIQKVTNEYVNIFGTDYNNWDLSISKNKWIDTIKQIDFISTKTFE